MVVAQNRHEHPLLLDAEPPGAGCHAQIKHNCTQDCTPIVYAEEKLSYAICNSVLSSKSV